MPAAVAAASGHQFLPLCGPRLLGQAGEGVILGQNADVGFTGAEGGGEGGGDVADALLHLEALLGQDLTELIRRLELHERELGVAPDGVGDLRDQGGLGVDGVDGGLFVFIHGGHSF